MTEVSDTALFPGAIGVFDSGVGGLSVLRAIRSLLPGHDLVYVADSGYAPYGDASPELITTRTLAIGRWLADNAVAGLTVACNTATVVAVRALRAAVDQPVIAIEPAIKPAVLSTRSGVVGVLATRRTLASDSVARLCSTHAGRAHILLQACPGLVERVEEADLEGPQTRALLRRYLEPLLARQVDTLVLGCTHYPFLSDAIRQQVGDEVRLIDPAHAVARELARRLGVRTGSESVPATAGRVRFFTSGDPVHAAPVISRLWGSPVRVEPLPGSLSRSH